MGDGECVHERRNVPPRQVSLREPNMITSAAVHSLTSPRHAYEDRSLMLGPRHPKVAAAGRGHIYAVMDGVGGAPQGMQAAQLIADGLVAFFDNAAFAPSQEDLVALMRTINDRAHALGFMAGSDRPLAAAAATVAWFSPGERVHILHAGDTVAWRFDGERLIPLTQTHGEGKMLRRYIGQGPAFALDCCSIAMEEGDMLVLATDGVTKALNAVDVAAIMRELPQPARAAREIVERARRRGSDDDITCLIAELEEW
jgi:serine/threonine protein phosphatase PrpC